MKKTMLSCALLLGISPFLVQCIATEQDLRGLEMRTRVMDNRISDLERLNETVRGQATSQARLGNELETFGNRLLQQEGRMDEADHRFQLLQESFHDTQQATSMRLDNIDITLQEIRRRLDDQDQRLDDSDQRLADSLAELQTSLQALEEKQERNRRQLMELKEELAREASRRAEAAQRAAEQARRETEERARRETAPPPTPGPPRPDRR